MCFLEITLWNSLMSIGSSWHLSFWQGMIEQAAELVALSWVGRIHIWKWGDNFYTDVRPLNIRDAAVKTPSLENSCKKWGSSLNRDHWMAANLKRQHNRAWVCQRVITAWPWGVIAVCAQDRKGGGSCTGLLSWPPRLLLLNLLQYKFSGF